MSKKCYDLVPNDINLYDVKRNSAKLSISG